MHCNSKASICVGVYSVITKKKPSGLPEGLLKKINFYLLFKDPFDDSLSSEDFPFFFGQRLTRGFTDNAF